MSPAPAQSPGTGTALPDDPRLPGLAHLAGTLVSHKPGKRAVVRSLDGTRYTKVVRPGKAVKILAGVERARPFAGPFATPRILASTPDTVTFAALTGQGLHDSAAFDDAEWARAWKACADAWVQAVGAGIEGLPGETPVHTGRAEARILADNLARASEVERIDPAFIALLDETAHLLVGRDIVPAPCHRDLHDKQLLFDGSTPGLLDVDTACIADIALDPANLRAHLRWRARQGIWSVSRARVAVDAVDEATAQAGVDPAALDLYERATWLRLGCLYAARPGWRETAAKLRRDLVAGGV